MHLLRKDVLAGDLRVPEPEGGRQLEDDEFTEDSEPVVVVGWSHSKLVEMIQMEVSHFFNHTMKKLDDVCEQVASIQDDMNNVKYRLLSTTKLVGEIRMTMDEAFVLNDSVDIGALASSERPFANVGSSGPTVTPLRASITEHQERSFESVPEDPPDVQSPQNDGPTTKESSDSQLPLSMGSFTMRFLAGDRSAGLEETSDDSPELLQRVGRVAVAKSAALQTTTCQSWDDEASSSLDSGFLCLPHAPPSVSMEKFNLNKRHVR